MLIFYYLGQKIMKKEKSKSTRLLYLIAISCLLIFAILVASAIIDIGNKLRNTNDTFGKYIEIGFYALMALIIIFGIIRPIYIIFRSPDLSIITVENQNTKMAIRTYKKVAKIIVKNNDLKEDESYAWVKRSKAGPEWTVTCSSSEAADAHVQTWNGSSDIFGKIDLKMPCTQ